MVAVRVTGHVKRIRASQGEIDTIYQLMRPDMPPPTRYGRSPEIAGELRKESELAARKNQERIVILEGPEDKLTIRFDPAGIYTLE